MTDDDGSLVAEIRRAQRELGQASDPPSAAAHLGVPPENMRGSAHRLLEEGEAQQRSMGAELEEMRQRVTRLKSELDAHFSTLQDLEHALAQIVTTTGTARDVAARLTSRQPSGPEAARPASTVAPKVAPPSAEGVGFDRAHRPQPQSRRVESDPVARDPSVALSGPADGQSLLGAAAWLGMRLRQAGLCENLTLHEGDRGLYIQLELRRPLTPGSHQAEWLAHRVAQVLSLVAGRSLEPKETRLSGTTAEFLVG